MQPSTLPVPSQEITRMRSFTRLAVVAVSMLLITSACGDDDATTPTTGATVTVVGTEDDPSTTSTAPPAPEGTPSPGDLSDLQARYDMTPLRTTYLIGDADSLEEIILAQDPTANPPIESITIPAGDTKIIISDGTTTVCDGGAASCFQIPGAGGESLAAGLLGPLSSLLVAMPEDLLGVDVTQEAITVAGREGVCFTYTPAPSVEADTDLIRQCVDNELGFTLLMQASEVGNDAVETVMELTDFASPTAEDFAIPYPVQAAPGS
jgi:hypothetical protein